MKRRILVGVVLTIITLTIFIGCGHKVETTVKNTEDDAVTVKDQREKMRKELKAEAIKAEYKEIHGNENEKAKLKVFIKGKVSNIDTSQSETAFNIFTVTTEEANEKGVYTVWNIFDDKVSEGDIVTVYGKLGKKASKIGAPVIIGLIER